MPAELLEKKGRVRNGFFIMESSGTQLARVGHVLENGGGKAVVDSVFELEETEEAFKRVEGTHARGKVVVKVAA